MVKTVDQALVEREYVALYRGHEITVKARTSYEAQKFAAEKFRAKKSWEVSVHLIDTPINTRDI
jgi:hypothetical protein